jgi:Rod binding domain-containing protein
MAQIPGLPSVADSALPASIRNGSSADKQAYKAALGFEQMLVSQMVKSMAGDSGALAEGPYADTMQASLTSAVESAGGLGLAQSLYKEIGDGSPPASAGGLVTASLGLASQGAIAQSAIPQEEVTR